MLNTTNVTRRSFVKAAAISGVAAAFGTTLSGSFKEAHADEAQGASEV